MTNKTTLKTSLYLVACSSLLLFLASPGQFSWGLLAWVGLIPLFLAIDQCRPGKAAKLGLLCGFSYYCAILYWILIVLGKYGSLPLGVSVPALFLLALYMGLYLAIFSAGLVWLKNSIARLWLAPILWVSLDLLRGHLMTGFPWLDLAYSQYQYPKIIQLVDITGHFGLSFLIVLVNYLIFEIYRSWRNNIITCERQILLATHTHTNTQKFNCKNSKTLILSYVKLTFNNKNHLIAFFLIITAFSYSFIRYHQLETDIRNKETISIGLIQGNIDQNKKWQQEIQKSTVSTYLKLSEDLLARTPVDLLIWPETALPFFPSEQPLFGKIVAEVKNWSGSSLITGAPHYSRSKQDPQIRYYNSAFIINPNSRQNPAIIRYDKQHLVPFGEYIPFGEYLPSSMPIVHSMGNFSSGESSQPIPCHNANIGLLICYESIFPGLARSRVKNGANLLVNLTNDAWYGNSSAPWQQLAMVVFRAVENRRSFARSANTGISCFIDPLGRQVALSPLFKPYTMAANVPLLTHNSPFTDYGHYFPWFCLLGLIPVVIQRARHKN